MNRKGTTREYVQGACAKFCFPPVNGDTAFSLSSGTGTSKREKTLVGMPKYQCNPDEDELGEQVGRPQ